MVVQPAVENLPKKLHGAHSNADGSRPPAGSSKHCEVRKNSLDKLRPDGSKGTCTLQGCFEILNSWLEVLVSVEIFSDFALLPP